MQTAAVQNLSPVSKRPPFITGFDEREESEVKCATKSTSGATLGKSTTNLEGGTGGAGEILVKKSVKKSKPDEEKFGKKIGPTFSDRAPKKTAQRAKGTTSLNKPIEKPSADPLEKTKAASGDKSLAAKVESAEKPNSKADSGKVAGEVVEKKEKAQLRKPGSKIAKAHTKIPCQVKSHETTEKPPPSSMPPCPTPPVETTINMVNEEPREESNTSSHTMSRSFFERLQLGVKAYFSSRNSFICTEKNKKEGGHQTRARVGKGVKEDARKRDPGFEFKNNNYISESDLLFDQLRLNSNLGGQSSNFLTDSPKTLENLKLKKLNHSKKHCVKIQIPRKGYFYRSSMQFKNPGQASSSSLQQLVPYDKPKSKSKVQISGMASTDSEVARVPGKKQLKKKQKPSNEADMGLVHSDAESFDSFWSGSSDWSISPKLLDFENDIFALSSAGKAEKRRSGKDVSFFNLFHEFGNTEREGEKQRSSISENSFSADGQKKKKKTTAGLGGDCFEVLESSPTRQGSTKRPKTSTLETLTNCINSVLGEDELIRSLEITPVNTKSDLYLNLQNVQEEPAKRPLITPVPIDYMSSASSGEMNPTAILMGEIDLHLELQNYLKAFNNFSISRSRTKNTLHSNNPIKFEGKDFRTEELFEGDEKISSPGYSPLMPTVSHCFLDDLEEERVESRLARSQTQLSSILNQMRKMNSVTEKGLHGKCATEESFDSYEKILPFGYHPMAGFKSPNIYDNHLHSSGESALQSQKRSPESLRIAEEFSWSLDLQDLIDVYQGVLRQSNNFKPFGRKSLRSFLFSFLSEKLIEKQNKTTLMELSKAVIPKRQGWKSCKRKDKDLEEYVAMFQRILKSPMSISEISHINSIISGLESRSEECVKNLKSSLEETLKKRKRAKKPPRQPTTALKRSSSIDGLSVLKSSPSLGRRFPRAEEEKKSLPPKNVLESFFNSEGKALSGLSRLKGKVLVDVKLSGDQIVVDDLSYLKNETSLPKKKTDAEGSSELIIESVTKSEFKSALSGKENKRTKGRKAAPKQTFREVKQKTKPAQEDKEVISEFEYDEVQLRTQHPIDPIAESSEQTILEKNLEGKIASSSETKITKSVCEDPHLLRKTLTNQVFLEDLIWSLKEEEKAVERVKSHLMKLPMTPQPMPKMEKPIKVVRSLIDLKTGPAICRRIHKTPSLWPRNSFLCYSSFQNAQEKPPKGSKKSKKSESALKLNRSRKAQEFFLKRQKSGAAILRPQTPGPQHPLYQNGRTSDSDSIELLFSEESSARELIGCEKPTGSSLMEADAGNSIDNPKSSVVLHSFNSAIDDRSYSLDLIHSDSFLKQFSQASILEKDTTILFKTNSDLKFQPVRVTDSRKDAKPLVTFVLTPEQFEKADLSADNALVIQKTQASSIKAPKNPPETEENIPQIRLKSIENFIEVMSISNPEHQKRKKKAKIKTQEIKSYAPSFSERKPKTRCQTCQLLSMEDTRRQQKVPRKTNGGLVPKSSALQSRKSLGKTETPKSVSQKEAKKRRNVQEERLEQESSETIEKAKSKERKTSNGDIEAAEEMSKLSVNLEDIPLELLEALKTTINHAESFKKKKIISTIEEGIEKRRQLNDEVDAVDKTPKSFILKIHCDKGSKKTEGGLAKKEVKMDAVKKIKDQNLEDVERSLKDDFGGAGEEVKENLKTKPGISVKPVSRGRTQSEELLLPKDYNDYPARDLDKLNLNEISNSLIEGQISSSLLLLDGFLKRKKELHSKKDNLKKLIQLVEENTEIVMTNLERSAWQKVLIVLDALSQLLVDENAEERLRARLQSTKAFIHKILELNISRLDDLQKFNSSMSDPKSGKEDEDDESNAFGVIRQCLKHFKQKLALKGILLDGDCDEVEPVQETSPRKEELTKSKSTESTRSEIRDMKNKVAEELSSLEKLFLVSDWRQSSSSWEETPSGMNLSENLKVSESASREAPSEDRLIRTPGCMRFMQCFMKVWDTRMSSNTYPSDYFR